MTYFLVIDVERIESARNIATRVRGSESGSPCHENRYCNYPTASIAQIIIFHRPKNLKVTHDAEWSKDFIIKYMKIVKQTIQDLTPKFILLKLIKKVSVKTLFS